MTSCRSSQTTSSRERREERVQESVASQAEQRERTGDTVVEREVIVYTVSADGDTLGRERERSVERRRSIEREAARVREEKRAKEERIQDSTVENHTTVARAEQERRQSRGKGWRGWLWGVGSGLVIALVLAIGRKALKAYLSSKI